jgi:hypothetical protein
MRYKLYLALLTMLLIATTLTGAATAQDDDLLSLYSDIPQSRAEDGAFVLGDPEAAITIIEFADYLCGHCQTYEATVSQFIDEYVVTGQAKYELRIIPIIHEFYSPRMAQIAECAYDQGKFWPANRMLFEMAANQEVGEDIVDVVAERLALDIDALNECLPNAQQHTIDDVLANDLGVTGTPAVRVQVGDGPRGAIQLEGTVFGGGGVSLDVLALFMADENPSKLVKVMKQLLDDSWLHDDSLVSNEPCATPCWRGITPGETSWEVAMTLLNEAEDLSEPRIDQSTDSLSIRASWAQGDNETCCQMEAQDGETISLIWLRLAPDMTLGELVETHGEPQYLVGLFYTSDQSYFIILYPEVPMMVFVYVDGVDGALSETSEIFGAQYITADYMAYMTESSYLHAWEGYQSFDYYMDGDFELTPE